MKGRFLTNAKVDEGLNKEQIEIRGIQKINGKARILDEINLTIETGEFFSILGRSGCGKTTLLRILAGLDVPTDGKIIIDGQDVTELPPYKRPINIMFQNYALFPHMTVYDNIAFGLKQKKMCKEDITSRVNEMLRLVRMTGYEHRKPDQLSGGQRQRVALARTLARNPKLILLDEPLTALDKRLREETQFELVNIQEKIGKTFIMVTHDQEEAMTMSTRMAIMEDGKIRQIGTPHEIYEYPNSRYVAEFIGSINLFDGKVVEHGLDYVLIETPDINCKCHASHTGALPLGSSVTLAIRPEKVMISTTKPDCEKNYTKGKIKDIAYLGDVSIYYVQVETGKTVMATIPNLLRLSERSFQWDDTIYLFWRSENSLVLTA